MANLELDEAELGLLRMLVQSRLGGLDVEMAHTDTRDYKDMLRAQRQTLERLAQKLDLSR